MTKLNFGEALEDINDGRYVDSNNVQTRALCRALWVAEWHLPGCLSESQSYCLTKADASESALSMANSPRGMQADLKRYGKSSRVSPDAWARGAITTVYRVTLGDLL